MPNPFSPKKILICQQQQIGDVVLATVCIRLLGERFPKASLHFLTEKKCAPVLENNPRLDRVWVIDKEEGFSGMVSLYSRIRKEKFDCVIDFQQLMRLKLAVLASGAKVKLSYPPKWYNRPFYNMAGQPLKGYAAKAKSGVLGPLGVAWDGLPPEIYVSEEEKKWAKQYFSELGVGEKDFLLTIDATHRRITRMWPASYYSQLIGLLCEKHPQIRILMLYGPGEKNVVEDIVTQAKVSGQCIVPERQTSLRQLAAILDRADGHLGNCSAPRHFAVAVGTPSFIIHGSNKSASWTFPSPKHCVISDTSPEACAPCNRSECQIGSLKCLYNIKPKVVCEKLCDFFLSR